VKKFDPNNFWKYYNTRGEISSERVIRLVDFLDRHNLTDQFKAEDAAGKRWTSLADSHSRKPLVDLLHDFLGPLNRCGN
jgi:hypothetical protein